MNNNNTNQNVNFTKEKIILDILKNDSKFINNLIKSVDKSNESDNKLKQKITRINFDSSNRSLIPKNIISKLIYLPNNPLTFTENSNILNIFSSQKHELSVNDRIILQNVKSNNFNMKGGLQLKNNSNFIKINHYNHGLKKDEFNKELFIKISNVVGNKNNNTSIENISLSLINKIHQIYFASETETYNENYYFIKIISLPTNDYIDTTSNINISFLNLSGININKINSNFPINIDQVNGFLTVNEIIDNYNFNVKLSETAFKNLSDVGGDSIYFSKIKDYIPAYIKPNSYRINLNKTFENVTRVKIISTEFPNTDKVIKNFPSDEKNNKLYFQVLQDNDYTYEIEITPGNYSTNSLAIEIKNEIENINRNINSDSLILNDGNNSVLEKSSNFSCSVNINQFTDIFSISLFNIVIIIKGITISNQVYDDQRKRIIINHVDHNLSVGDKITIAGASSTSGIPSSVINIEHEIESIIDSNNYVIKLPLHNESNTIDNNGGGSAINILIPLFFRLLFDKKDTLGNLLGFRNVGETNSITSFQTTISNNVAYEYDYFKDSVGNEIYFDDTNNNVQNNVIQLFGFNYILMTCNIFNNEESLSTNYVNGVFAKLLLSDAPGSILFNQYIQLAEFLSKPIKSLSEFEFNFYSPSGELYEFNGLDHSFTLEIYEDHTSLNSTNINPKTSNILTDNYSENKKLDISDFNLDLQNRKSKT